MLRVETGRGRREAPESFFVPFVRTFLLLRDKSESVARGTVPEAMPRTTTRDFELGFGGARSDLDPLLPRTATQDLELGFGGAPP